jgi:hypothetical protein
MSYCSKCGKELGKDAKFCPKCGAAVGVEGRVSTEARYTEKRRQDACFGPPGSGGGLWGAISVGVFIVGLGILWFLDWFWPGILFLVGLMIVIGALVSYARR